MRYDFSKPRIKYGKAFSYTLKEWKVFDMKTTQFYIVDGFTEKEARRKLYNAIAKIKKK